MISKNATKLYSFNFINFINLNYKGDSFKNYTSQRQKLSLTY